MISYHLDFDTSKLHRDQIHNWLKDTYWCPNIRRDVFDRAIDNSIPVGAYVSQDDGGSVQVGFARAVTDRATYVWIADVYVDSDYRGNGIARAMVRALMEHPDLQTVRSIRLGTKDAHGVYAGLGFEPIPDPEGHMRILYPSERWQEI